MLTTDEDGKTLELHGDAIPSPPTPLPILRQGDACRSDDTDPPDDAPAEDDPTDDDDDIDIP